MKSFTRHVVGTRLRRAVVAGVVALSGAAGGVALLGGNANATPTGGGLPGLNLGNIPGLNLGDVPGLDSLGSLNGKLDDATEQVTRGLSDAKHQVQDRLGNALNSLPEDQQHQVNDVLGKIGGIGGIFSA
jgi:hypothetical protein